MHYLNWFIDHTYLDTIFICLLIVAALEIALAPRRFRWKMTAWNYVFIVTTMTVEVGVRWATVASVGWAVTRVGGPVFDLTRANHISLWTQAYAAVSYLLVFDFFFYWHHRISHKYPVFWETHKLHHAQENLNGSSAFVNHWTDSLLRIVTVYLPMGVLFKFEPVTLSWFIFATTFHVIFTHVDFNVPLGPLTPVINGPQLHRIHHTNQPERIDKNFAFYFPIWDVIFGTYLRPEKGHHEPTGLTSGETIHGLFAAHGHPFAAWFRMVKEKLSARGAASSLE
ncbi:sterol desaturase family protein [Burkholderia pseudomallei]|uniref:sterol desaturase family protein n=1 Tax=Burkholderia pseudomallei TaxID=28450 RepID=UPI000A1E22C2|nr:sterol desaturase family protein [Burkholderia pseudomallei]OSO82691.1 hypothetical protein BOC56_21780 [Burkholderia pseudomallei]